MKHKADVVIIGGGIIGAACAYYLCQALLLPITILVRNKPGSRYIV